mmetsp:Transcript_85500/g.207226  ORF Transcript_85500/g.207226 Transcript_85500/m.207226 type:complete len:473 (-) Transcript_85500:24-1442(-)
MGTGEWALVGTQADDKGVLMVGFDELGGAAAEEDHFGGGYGDESADPAFAASRSRRDRVSMSTDGGPEVWRAGGADTTGDISADLEMGGFGGGGLEDEQFGGMEMGGFDDDVRRESMISMGDGGFGGPDVDMENPELGGDFGTPSIRLAEGGAGGEITAADLQDDDAGAGAASGSGGVRAAVAAKRKFHQVDSAVMLSTETLRSWLNDPEFSTVAPYKSAKRRAADMKAEVKARQRRYRGFTGNEALPPNTFAPFLRPDVQKLLDSFHTGKHGIPMLSEEEKAERDADVTVPTPSLNRTTDTDYNAQMGYEDFGGMEMGGFDEPPVDAGGMDADITLGGEEVADELGVPDAELEGDADELGMKLSMSEKSGKSALEAEPLADSSGPSGKWNTRTKRVLETLNASLESRESISYRDLAGKSSRHTVAGCFFELLVLKSWDVVDVEQDEAYDEIHISKNGDKFADAVAEMTADA